MVGAGVRPDAGAAGGGAAAGPGYLLLRDAVSTPRSYLSDTALGLGESAPRASPQDFAVALASHVLDGGVVVKVLLVAGCGWLGGVRPAGRTGAARCWARRPVRRDHAGDLEPLCRRAAIAGALESVGRLRLPALGCVEHGGSAPRFKPTGFFALACWVPLAGLTPTGLMLAATVALVCAATPGPGIHAGCAGLQRWPWQWSPRCPG
ncbi:putative membrane domain protein [Mycobacterium xenopi 4042]|uniref:Putative membrane domain protein n=1 Tax=Mycobacterium xenopi 4042 TaxID=1299334 RepID=X7ZCC5_MYCXE|nr:putative membrane domain protein [Mycobacterium xenopi 4042]